MHYDYTTVGPVQRLKSRKPTWKLVEKFVTEKLNRSLKLAVEWSTSNIDINHLFDQPTGIFPGFELPRKQWLKLTSKA